MELLWCSDNNLKIKLKVFNYVLDIGVCVNFMTK